MLCHAHGQEAISGVSLHRRNNKKKTVKKNVSAFPVCQMNLNFFEENSSSREHMWELQSPVFMDLGKAGERRGDTE